MNINGRPYKLCGEAERLFDAWWQAAERGDDNAEELRQDYWRHRVACDYCPPITIGGLVAAEKAREAQA